MPKITERWLLFKYVGPEFTPLSKPLNLEAPQDESTSGEGAAEVPRTRAQDDWDRSDPNELLNSKIEESK
jgi:hypothetical protein